MGNTKSQKSSATVLILKNTTVLCLSRRFTLCCIPRPIRLEASLKAWSFPANSKSVQSSLVGVSVSVGVSVFCRTGFINFQLAKIPVWTKLKASENSEDNT